MENDIVGLENNFIMQTYKRLPLVLDSGHGCALVDDHGREYIDMTSGLGVINLGHCHPEVTAAIAEQAVKLDHVSNLFYTKPQARLAEKLCDVSFGLKVFFANSGAEANEGVIKIARKYARLQGKKDKFKIVSAYRGFHGRTLAALAATGQPEKQEYFKPMPQGFVHGKFNNLGSFAEIIDDDTCAVILELIQGEGGVNIAEQGFIDGVAELCQKHDALLSFDEVQTGLGRTGKMFAYEHYGITPDIMTVAKGLANGLPIGAIIAGGKASEVLEKGDHATTFGGGPVVCAAAEKVLEILARDNIVKRSETLGQKAMQVLAGIAKDSNSISEVRGKGLMMAVELKNERANDVVIAGIERGVLYNTTGPSTIRLLPPLVIEEDILLKGLRVLEEILDTIK